MAGAAMDLTPTMRPCATFSPGEQSTGTDMLFSWCNKNVIRQTGPHSSRSTSDTHMLFIFCLLVPTRRYGQLSLPGPILVGIDHCIVHLLEMMPHSLWPVSKSPSDPYICPFFLFSGHQHVTLRCQCNQIITLYVNIHHHRWSHCCS